MKNINTGSVGSASDIKEKWDRKEYSDIETGYVNALISGIMPRLRADSYSRNDSSETHYVDDDGVVVVAGVASAAACLPLLV